jgi:alpha-pyrone synthase
VSAYLTSIGTAVPAHAIDQATIAGFMARLLGLSGEAAERLQKLYAHSGITRRHSVLPDYNRQVGQFAFFPNTENLEPFPGVEARMGVYRAEAPALARQAIAQCLEATGLVAADIDHLVTVSCTGMYAPGLDIDLVQSLGMAPTTRRYCINFMGCYAAFNGLKLADALVRSHPGERVLVVCVELCTLHFQKSLSMDHLVSNSLFSDGAAAALVESAPRGGAPRLRMDTFHALLCPDSLKDMAWQIGDTGFQMTLSKYVAGLLEGGIGALAETLLGMAGVHKAEIGGWAIHPGGRRILEACQAELGLDEEDLAVSRQVLRSFGNMSSVTILFVLADWLRGYGHADGERLIAAAFGPGLTMESALMQLENR